MSEVEGPFFRAGADGVLLEEFRALAETGRYPERPVLIWLARFIVGMGGGPNKDSPLLELCHLVHGIDYLIAASTGGAGVGDGRTMFFLSLERAVPRTVGAYFEDFGLTGLPTDPIRMDGNALVIDYDDGLHEIKLGRMPSLMALYEFLASMDGFEFYGDLAAIFDAMSTPGDVADRRAVKDATNKIASRLRQYRRAHMDWAANDEKFDRIFPFLKERGEDGQLNIDDAAILDFWTLHSHGKEFKGYKTVFDAFVTFQRALHAGNRTQAAEQAVVMGTDREVGEVDPVDQAYDLGAFGDWASPFDVLDEDGLKEIKFFKGVSERKPIEPLMQYGPDAVRLPLAFLRLESFGPIQAGITNDLQVKRGQASVEKRITCADAETYDDRRGIYADLLAHIRALEKAALHGILKTQGAVDRTVIAFPGSAVATVDEIDNLEGVADEAREAFQSMTRKGFEDFVDNVDDRGDAFRRSAGALVTMAHVLQGMLDAAGDLDGNPSGLEQLFAADRDVFRAQFGKIYGDVS